MPAWINETPWDASVGQELAVIGAFALGLFVGVRRRSAARRAAVEERVRGLEERDALARERARIAREPGDAEPPEPGPGARGRWKRRWLNPGCEKIIYPNRNNVKSGRAPASTAPNAPVPGRRPGWRGGCGRGGPERPPYPRFSGMLNRCRTATPCKVHFGG